MILKNLFGITSKKDIADKVDEVKNIVLNGSNDVENETKDQSFGTKSFSSAWEKAVKAFKISMDEATLAGVEGPIKMTTSFKSFFSTLWSGLSVFSKFAIGIGAVVAAGVAISTIYNKYMNRFNDSVDKASESLSKYQESSLELENLENKAKSCKESLEELANKYNIELSGSETVDEIISKIDGVETISLTDETDLANLRAENEELERQIQLQKQIVEADQKQSEEDAKVALNMTATDDLTSQKDNYNALTYGALQGQGATYAASSVLYEQTDIRTATKNEIAHIRELNNEKLRLNKEYNDAKTKADKERISNEIANVEKESERYRDAVAENIESLNTLKDSFKDSTDAESKAIYDDINDIIDSWNNIDLSDTEQQLKAIESYFSKSGRNHLKKQIVDAVKSGKSAKDIFEEMGVSLEEAGFDAETLNRYFDEIANSANKAADAMNSFDPPTVEDVEYAFDSENQGKAYDSIAEKFASAKEMAKKGLWGLDDLQTMTQWILPYDIDDETFGSEAYIKAWEEAYGKVNGWFNTENPMQGMWSFLDDLNASDNFDFFSGYDKSTGLVEFSDQFTSSAQAADELGVSLDTVETMLHKLKEFGFTFDDNFKFSGEMLSEYESAISGIKDIYESTEDEDLKARLGVMLDKESELDFENNIDELTKDKIIEIQFEYDLAQLDQEIANLKAAAAAEGYGNTSSNADIMAANEARKSKWEERNQSAITGGYTNIDSIISDKQSSMIGQSEERRAAIQREIIAMQELQTAFANSFDSGESVNWEDFLDSESMFNVLDSIEKKFGVTKDELKSILGIEIPDLEANVNTNINKEDIKKQLNELSEGGNVDLTMRPVIDSSELANAGWDVEAGEAATVFTSTFANEAGNVAMNFTPIMTDENGNYIGTMSPEELQSYAEDVMSGIREDDLGLKIGATYEGKDAINKAEADAEKIHKLHEDYFSNETKSIAQSDSKTEKVSEKDSKADVGTYLEQFNKAMTDMGSQMNSFFMETIPSGFNEIRTDITEYFSQMWTDISTFFVQTIPSVIADVNSQINNFFNVVVPQKWNEFLNNLEAEFSKVGAWADNIKGKINEFFTTVVPQKWEEFLSTTDAIFTEHIPYAIGYITGKISAFFTQTIPQKWEEFLDKASEAFDDFKGGVSEFKDQVGDFFTNTVPEAWNELWSEVSDVLFNEIPEAISSFSDSCVDFFTSTIPNAWNEFWNNVEGAVNTGVSYVGELYNKVVTFFTSTVPSAWNNFWDGVNQYIQNNVVTAIVSLGQKVQTFFTSTVPNAWNNFWSGVGTAINTTIPTAVANVKSGITTFFTVTVPGCINSMWSSIGSWIRQKASSILSNLKAGFSGGFGGAGLAGTAHAKGTAYSKGSIPVDAFSNPRYKTTNSEVALTGEEGQELVVNGNRWWTVGDRGAEFSEIPSGSIIFNARQTKELLGNGFTNSRGKAYLHGNAFKSGGYLSGGSGGSGSSSSGSNGSGNNSSGNSSNNSSSNEAFEEIKDWVEVYLQRQERITQRLTDAIEDAVGLVDKQSATNKAIAQVQAEIVANEKAAARYKQQADSVGLSDVYKQKVIDGTIDIETITDENLKEKIDKFTEWHEKMLGCEDSIESLKDDLKDLAQQKFDNVTTEFENQISLIEHEKNVLEALIDQTEERGHLVSSSFYKDLIAQEKDNLSKLEQEYSTLTTTLQGLLDDGLITKYSDEWYDMQGEINDVSEAIIESNTALIEFKNNIRDLDWEVFDMLLERMSQINDEKDFLVDLMSDEDLFDSDTAKITEQGKAVLGLHAMSYNTLMAEADEYAKELKDIEKLLESDPYNLDLTERYNELLEEQRDHILEAKDAFASAIDVIKDGFDAFLEVMQKAIDKRKDALNAEKDLYDYQKQIAEQTKEIGNLEKQLSAYQGDDSEESRATIQQLKVDYEEAKQALEETEYDKYLSDQEQMLDALYDETEEWINQRLDDQDWLLQQLIDYTNENANTIKDTLHTEADAVGYELSEAMNSIWSPGGTYSTVVAGYVDGFTSLMTTTNNTLDTIRKYLAEIGGIVEEEEKQEETVKPVEPPAPPVADTPKEEQKPTTTTTTGDGTPKVGDKVTFASGSYFLDSGGTAPTGNMNLGKEVYITSINKASWAKKPYHISTGSKLGNGDLGWVTLEQLKGYSQGGLIDETGLFVGHGKTNKPEMVLDARDTRNFIELKDALRDKQGLFAEDTIAALRNAALLINPIAESMKFRQSIPNLTSNMKAQSISIEIGDIQMYGVNKPEEFAQQLKYTLQNNKSVMKIIQSDTLGVMAGKNSLNKYKY